MIAVCRVVRKPIDWPGPDAGMPRADWLCPVGNMLPTRHGAGFERLASDAENCYPSRRALEASKEVHSDVERSCGLACERLRERCGSECHVALRRSDRGDAFARVCAASADDECWCSEQAPAGARRARSPCHRPDGPSRGALRSVCGPSTTFHAPCSHTARTDAVWSALAYRRTTSCCTERTLAALRARFHGAVGGDRESTRQCCSRGSGRGGSTPAGRKSRFTSVSAARAHGRVAAQPRWSTV